MTKNQVQHLMDLHAQENLLILEELQVYQDDEYAKGARTSMRLKRLIEREKNLLKELRTRERLMSSGLIWLEGEPGLVFKGASVTHLNIRAKSVRRRVGICLSAVALAAKIKSASGIR